MASAVLRNGVLSLAAAGLLMGCVEGAGSSSGNATKAAPSAFRTGSAQEVEAPEVYQVTDSALWDGRPSLGGIWVAAPDVVDPERVVILNPATGKSVTGALFRRERDNPGPLLQVSSDAAEALGMLAGQPTSLRVTALRKATEPEPAAAPAESTAVAAAESPEAAANAGDPAAAETAALATAALAATGGTAEAAADAGAATAAAADGTAEAGSEVAATEPPKKKTWKERRAEARAKREAEKAAAAAAAASAAAAEGTGAAPDEPAATADEAAVASVETAPLDARDPEAVAATPEAAPAPPAAEAAAAPATAGPARSIQIASFSKEENAKRAVEALAKISVTAEVRRSEQGGKVVWGVVTSGDDTQLAAIKKAGFADAYFLD